VDLLVYPACAHGNQDVGELLLTSGVLHADDQIDPDASRLPDAGVLARQVLLLRPVFSQQRAVATGFADAHPDAAGPPATQEGRVSSGSWTRSVWRVLDAGAALGPAENG
jgi:hypothetical protein